MLRAPWQVASLAAALGGLADPRAADGLTHRLVERWPEPPRGTYAELVEELGLVLTVRHRLVPEPPDPTWRWPVQEWNEVHAPAAGLGLREGEPEWFADPGGWLRTAPAGPLHHYRRRWRVSPNGSPRLLESPGPRLARRAR
ncbi:MAG TPA: hypothetical protein VGO23_15170 [Pseudonocardia sp.]|nr:hypothetical protein [Pseudonocardia sp.]